MFAAPTRIDIQLIRRASTNLPVEFVSTYMEPRVGILQCVTDGVIEDVGSAFIYSNKMFALTCYQSVSKYLTSNSQSLQIKFRDHICPCKVALFNAEHDIAVVEFEWPQHTTHTMEYFKMASFNLPAVAYCGGYDSGNLKCTEGEMHYPKSTNIFMCSNKSFGSMRGGPCVGGNIEKLYGMITTVSGEDGEETVLVSSRRIHAFLRLHPLVPGLEAYIGS